MKQIGRRPWDRKRPNKDGRLEEEEVLKAHVLGSITGTFFFFFGFTFGQCCVEVVSKKRPD